MPLEGSIEIKTADGMSLGVPGKRWVLTTVPVVLETLYGITGMKTATPKVQPTGQTPYAQWSAVDARNQQVTVLLWKGIMP